MSLCYQFQSFHFLIYREPGLVCRLVPWIFETCLGTTSNCGLVVVWTSNMPFLSRLSFNRSPDEDVSADCVSCKIAFVLLLCFQ